ncbi:hypothetical protein TSAR_006209, partial [Trichomalopsis sarcophagae]
MHLKENKNTHFFWFGPRDRPLCLVDKMKKTYEFSWRKLHANRSFYHLFLPNKSLVINSVHVLYVTRSGRANSGNTLLPSCQASGSPRRRGALGARLRTIFSHPRPGFQTFKTRTETAADYDMASSTPSSAAVFASVLAIFTMAIAPMGCKWVMKLLHRNGPPCGLIAIFTGCVQKVNDGERCEQNVETRAVTISRYTD